MTLRILIACETSGIARLRSRSFPGMMAAAAAQWAGHATHHTGANHG